jgi:hypothetical protein
VFDSDSIWTSYQGLETSSLAGLAPGYFRCFCNCLSRPQLVDSVESSIELYRLLSTVFDVLIFSHPSDLQKHCAKDLFVVAALEIMVSTQRVLHHRVLHWLAHTVLDSLDNPICGKDLGLPGPSSCLVSEVIPAAS